MLTCETVVLSGLVVFRFYQPLWVCLVSMNDCDDVRYMIKVLRHTVDE
jgi:hypothetical protein